MAERGKKAVIVALVAALLVGLGIGLATLLAPGRAESGPVPIVWDKTACAWCRMHIGEPAFAAQLQTADGRVLDFDDPGCLFEYLAENQPWVEAMYFHHVDEDRWLKAPAVGFVLRTPTPMGYGLAAVSPDHPGALSFEQARQRILRSRQAKTTEGHQP